MIKNKSKTLLTIFYAMLIVGVLHGIFIMISGKTLWDSTPYNSFAVQVEAWLSGRLDLGEDLPWLELAIYEGKFFVSFPPFPSYLLLPLRLIFSQTFESLLAFLVMQVGVAYAVRITQKLNLRNIYCIILPVLLYCGTNTWQVTVDGWVWFIAQNISLTATLASIYYAQTGKKGKSAFFLAAAVGCRPFQIVYFPLVLILLYQRTPKEEKFIKRALNLVVNKIYNFIPAFLLVVSYMVLNIARFGKPFEFGHNYLPEFLEAEHGQFHWGYLAENIKFLFNFPESPIPGEGILSDHLFYAGVNIFIVFPIFVVGIIFFIELCVKYFLNEKERDNSKQIILINIIIFILVVVHMLLLMLHKTMGGVHFGNRYIVDVLAGAYFGFCLLTKSLEVKKEVYSDKNTVPISSELIKTGNEVLIFLALLSGLVINISGVLAFYIYFM